MQTHPVMNAVSGEASVAKAAVQALGESAAAFDHWLAQLMLNSDPTAVHKARVALRRFRVGIRGFRDVIEPDVADRLDNQARRYFRILSEVRDLDVLAASHERHASAAGLQADAAKALQKARRHLKKTRAASFLNQTTRTLAGKSWRKPGKKAKALLVAPTRIVAANALQQTWEKCTSNGADLKPLSARARHDLRKDLKSLRYLSEIFSGLWPEPEVESCLHLLRKLQDDLGALTDLMMAKKHGLTPETDAQRQAWLENAACGWAQLQNMRKWWDQPTRLP